MNVFFDDDIDSLIKTRIHIEKLGDSQFDAILKQLPYLAKEENNAVAQFFLGICYYYGARGDAVKIEQNDKTAFAWFKKSAEQGYVLGQYYTGLCYYNQKGTALDYPAAFDYFSKAAKQGFSEAIYKQAVCYYQGDGVVKDIETAIRLFIGLGKQDDICSWIKLKKISDENKSNDKESVKIRRLIEDFINEIKEQANKGDAEAKYQLAVLANMDFDGIEKDAHDYAIEAMDKKNYKAYALLGSRHYYENNDQSQNFLELSADEGFSRAESSLGIYYFINKINLEKGGELLIKAARKGVSEAQSNLSYFFSRALLLESSVRNNDVKSMANLASLYWLGRNSENGDGDNHAEMMGLIYFYGTMGLQRDYAEAGRCFKKSLKHDSALGHYYMGYCYKNGLAITDEPDPDAAMVHFNKALELESGGHAGNIVSSMVFKPDIITGLAKLPSDNQEIIWELEEYNIWASYNWGIDLLKGNGVARNPEKAFFMFRIACYNGSREGMYEVGRCLFKGVGTQWDIFEGLTLLWKAACRGSTNAIVFLLMWIGLPILLLLIMVIVTKPWKYILEYINQRARKEARKGGVRIKPTPKDKPTISILKGEADKTPSNPPTDIKTVHSSITRADDFVVFHQDEIHKIITNNWKIPKIQTPDEYEEKLKQVVAWFGNFEPQEFDLMLMLLGKICFYSNQELIDGMAKKIRSIFNGDLNRINIIGVEERFAASGTSFLSDLEHRLGLPSKQFKSLLEIGAGIATLKALVFIDDIVGTGNQACDSFNDKQINMLGNLEKYYVPYLAYQEGISHIENNFDVKVRPVYKLTSIDRAFSENSKFFSDYDTREKIKKIAQKYGKEMCQYPLGYGNSEALIVFEHNVPDNTLPIIWANDDCDDILKDYQGTWHPLWPRSKKH